MAATKYLRRTVRILLRTLVVLILFGLLYFLAAQVFSRVPVNASFSSCKADAVEVYLLTNGVHTDIVVPLKNNLHDWSQWIHPADTKSHLQTANYAAFGWGDKGFYLETPTWADLKASTAFKAMFWLSSSAIHVTFYNQLQQSASCRKVCIDSASYRKLVGYINQSFEQEEGAYRLIPGASYERNDLFYEARGTYNLFFTCNTWANQALKESGLPACMWTPFDWGIFNQYR